MNGRPAAGVAISLYRRDSAGAWALLVQTKTNADGRTDAPLLTGAALLTGVYELRFHVGAYFAGLGAGTATASPFAARLPFLDEVPVRFGVADPTAGYHVPLLVTPWSYSTYRGS